MFVFFAVFFALLALPVLWPELDLLLSSLFVSPNQGFIWGNSAFLNILNRTAYVGSRVMGVVFIAAAILTWLWRRPVIFSSKAWLFLFIALVLGPGLIANVGFKDHWGRSRPRDVVEFGGTKSFSPALSPRFDAAKQNGSFVSGDGAFGFFLPAFAFVVPRRHARRTFWSAMAVGSILGFARIASGAHFFSDVVFAGFIVLAATTAVHACMYGLAETKARWSAFFNGAGNTQRL